MSEQSRRGIGFFVGLAVVAAGASVAALALFLNIVERKQEALQLFPQVVEITEATDDPAEWGKNFPNQYESYLRTVDQTRTRFGGSEALPRTPSEADPRSVVSQSKIEEDPRLKTMWAGYAFSRDFREERGHAYMLEDQTFTERQAVGQPGTCANCHASTVTAWRELGDGDLTRGFEIMNPMPYMEAVQHLKGAVGCIDCHEPGSMKLRVTRPAFMEGMRAFKAGQGVADYDVNRDATRQEMRSFVCGQCHVEYYFKGTEKRLVFPWANGLEVEKIYDYYQEAEFKDWTHAQTGAPVLKAQHPEFEMWNQGIHARSGVACADCHMPYRRVGAQKVSDHHVQSPLLNVNAACQTCHNLAEDEIVTRVERIQAHTFRMRNQAMDALMDLIGEIQARRDAGASDAALDPARELQRRAQFYLDFVEAENSTGFHAPQEATRILGEALDYARQGQLVLRDPGYTPRIAPPSR
ncbi:MAG TPA: ammonia-forming cytochrome c nitrite reductase subunit c552 [Longimicrobiales bacterium]|nr:ammonia-forming cytochrome c nitrite reductase subunit c552 [Longimicrobiales bacterium]